MKMKKEISEEINLTTTQIYKWNYDQKKREKKEQARQSQGQ